MSLLDPLLLSAKPTPLVTQAQNGLIKLTLETDALKQTSHRTIQVDPCTADSALRWLVYYFIPDYFARLIDACCLVFRFFHCFFG